MDRHVGRDRWATDGERLKDQRSIETRKPRPANIGADVNAAHAERGAFAHLGDRKMLGFVPGERVRRKHFNGESPRHLPHRELIFAERKLRCNALRGVEHDSVSQPGG